MRRRFGLASDEEEAILRCEDVDRLDTATEALVDQDATKETILGLLTGNGS